MKPTKVIRKELAILIKEKQKTCKTEKEKNKAVDDARQEINLKYGKGWREQCINESQPKDHTKYKEPSIHDDHENGEYWMD